MASGGGSTAPSGPSSSTLSGSSVSTPAGGSAATAPFSEEQREWIEKLISSRSAPLPTSVPAASPTPPSHSHTGKRYSRTVCVATSLNTCVAGTWPSARLLVAIVSVSGKKFLRETEDMVKSPTQLQLSATPSDWGCCTKP